MRLGRAAVVVIGFFLAATFWPRPVPDKATERFTATRIDPSDEEASKLELVIERRSTNAERQQLLDSLQETGPQKLLETIQTLPRVGYMRDEKGTAYDLHYVYGVKSEDGTERVMLATDRPTRFSESGEETLSTDTPFTLIELRVNGNGQGYGKLSLVTQLTAKQPRLPVTLEDYDVRPLYLLRVQREGTRQ